MRGIDVSNVNGAFSWRDVKAAGVRFAFVKASEGLTYNDAYMAGHRSAARLNAIAVGLYHFARPDLHKGRAGAIAEARHFARRIGRLGPLELRPALDLEHAAGGDLTAWALAFLTELERLVGVRPIFYSYSSFIRSNMGGARGLERFPLWLADYGPNDGRQHAAAVPGRWSRISIHQYTSNGRIAGIGGRVDLNELRVPLETLLAIAPADPPAAKRSLYPRDARFWLWLRWRLGEGGYKRWGPRNASVRPRKLPAKIPGAWWKGAQRFLAARRRGSS